jgi:hypothetical protein
MALRNIAAAVAGLALLAGPALAQTPSSAVKSPSDLNDAQMEELYCIYDQMATGANEPVLTASIVRGEKDAATKARALHDAARGVCVGKYKWEVEQAEVAGAVATSAILADMMEGELRDRGFDDRKFEAVMKIADKLSPEDFKVMIGMAKQKADAATLNRVRKQLTDAGVPSDKDTVEMAMAFLQGSMAEYDAVLRWVDKKYY